jgi:hypothetical protein
MGMADPSALIHWLALNSGTRSIRVTSVH